MKYTLRQLQVFLAAASHNNISRAAEELHLSQSAASNALKELEGHYQIQLFDRVGKRLQLNEQGRRLRPLAEALLNQAQELESGLLQQSEGGKLQVGATLTIGNYLAVDMVADYMSRYPEASINLHVANTESIAAQVLNFELDIGLIEGELNHPDLKVVPWQEDELVVFCAPNNPLANKSRISDKDLVRSPWVLREHGSGTRQTFDRGMHELLPELTIAFELEHTEAIKRAVESGLGISCLSRIALQSAFEHRRLVPLSVPKRDFKRKFYFILHKQKYISTSVKHWLSLCREYSSRG